MRKNNTNKPPRSNGKDISEEEKRLGQALAHLRSYYMNQYYYSFTREEKDEFIRKYPKIDEVIKIIEEIDRNNPRRNKLEQAKEKRDTAKRKEEAARKLQEEVKSKLDKEITKD